MKWEVVFRLLGFRLSPVPFKNHSCRYNNWRPNSLPTDFRSFIDTDRNTVSVPLLCWYTHSKRTIKTHALPVWSCLRCRSQTNDQISCVKLHEAATSKLMRCMPQSALNCCTKSPALLVYLFETNDQNSCGTRLMKMRWSARVKLMCNYITLY